jgi:hypothetical protein
MAEGPKQKKQKGTPNGKPDFRFINYDLSKADKEWLASADLDAEYPLALVCDLVAEGYKFGLSFDDRNQSYVASLTDRSESSTFYNSCLTGRGATALDAWCSLAYRHLHLAQGDWTMFNQSGNREPSRFE